MSSKNKKLLTALGVAAVVVIVIAAVLLGKGGQTTTVDPASTPSDVSAEDVDSSNTPDGSSSEPLVVVPDASKPEATDSQNQTDAVLNVEEEDQVDVNLTDSEKKPETTPPPAPSQEEQQAASEKDEPIVHEPDSNQPQTGDTQGGSIYLEGFGWITDEGGGSVQHNIDSDGDINKQVGNIYPISTELFSKNEKRLIAKQLTVSLSSAQYPFQLLAVSRPVDISPLLSELSATLTSSSDVKQKELLKQEIVEMGAFALSGEVVERQFYIKIWDRVSDGVERDLLQKLKLLGGYFSDSGIQTEILQQQDIVRLCNLVNNPAYVHLEDSGINAAIPILESVGVV